MTDNDEYTEQDVRNSDMIFTQIISRNINHFDAKKLILEFYIPNMDISLRSIKMVLQRLEEFYKDKS